MPIRVILRSLLGKTSTCSDEAGGGGVWQSGEHSRVYFSPPGLWWWLACQDGEHSRPSSKVNTVLVSARILSELFLLCIPILDMYIYPSSFHPSSPAIPTP